MCASSSIDFSSRILVKVDLPPRKHKPNDFISASNPCCYSTIFDVTFFTYHLWETNVKISTISAHPICCRHYKRCESAVFNLHYTFIVILLFLFFINFIWFRKFLFGISRNVWISKPHIKKCCMTCFPEP